MASFLKTISNLLSGKGGDPFFESNGYSVSRFFLQRRSLRYNDPQALWDAYAQHELVYACINKIADVMNDAEIIVEKRIGDKWESIDHPMVNLFKRPNKHETGRDLRRLMVQSEQAAGIVFCEIERSRAGLPAEIYVLNPNKVTPRINKQNNAIDYYDYMHGDGTVRKIKLENMLIRRRADLVNRFWGLSPLGVALKSINSDLALSDYVDAFFESDGTPSGLLKISNRKLSQVEAEALQERWRMMYGRGGRNHKGVAVLDADGEYQKLGSNLNELDSRNITHRFEARICSVFGVPPILVGSLVGLEHTTANATAKSALNDFWDNKVNPELAQFREWMTWFMLPEFDGIEAVESGKLRVGYDVSHAAFLQEDENEAHERIRADFQAGLMMVNEAREALRLPADESARGEDYYIQPANVTIISPERRAEEAAEEPEVAMPPQLIEGETEEEDEETEETPKLYLPSVPPRPIKQTTVEPAVSAMVEQKAKGFDYDGLMLSRAPEPVEELCDLKAMVRELEITQDRAAKVLRRFRKSLIEQAVVKLEDRNPGNAHMILLEPDTKVRKELSKALRNAFAVGQNQIVRELDAQRAAVKAVGGSGFETKSEHDLDYLDDLTDGLVARIINEIQTRAINQFLALKLLGSYAATKLREVLFDQKDTFIEDLAGASVNAAMQAGRADEAEARRNEWDTVQYSAILDQNTCDPCESADGMEADDPAKLPPAPNPDCEGGARCRCFHVYIVV